MELLAELLLEELLLAAAVVDAVDAGAEEFGWCAADEGFGGYEGGVVFVAEGVSCYNCARGDARAGHYGGAVAHPHVVAEFDGLNDLLYVAVGVFDEVRVEVHGLRLPSEAAVVAEFDFVAHGAVVAHFECSVAVNQD